jgi:hypothetical protein
MRGEYGKLAYLLQDAVSPRLQAHLHCNIAGGGIRTGMYVRACVCGCLFCLLQRLTQPHQLNPTKSHAVYKLLEAAGGLKLLDDPQIHTATQEILPDAGKSRAQVNLLRTFTCR